jgi:predicted alpha/beta superfamily hydrolase
VYEFSPEWDLQDAFGRVVARTCERVHADPGKCVGGAAKFLNAIGTELIPLVAARYPIDTANLGLFGISAGGYFASWTVFQPNSPFKKYIISSPAMAYGNGEIFRQEARYATDHRDLPVGIYFGAGTLEAGQGFLEGVGQIVSGMSRIAGLLGGRNYPGLKLVTEYHPGMSHGDVMGTSVVRGLRNLYGQPDNPGVWSQ